MPEEAETPPQEEETDESNSPPALYFHDACAATFAIDPYLAHAARDLYDAAIIAVQQLLASVPEDSPPMQQLLAALGASFGAEDPCLTEEESRIDAILGMMRTSGGDTRIEYARQLPPHSLIQSISQAAQSHIFDRERAKSVRNPWRLWLKHAPEKPVLLVRATEKQQTALLDFVQQRQAADWAPNTAIVPPHILQKLSQSPAAFYSHLQAGTHLAVNTVFIPSDIVKGGWEELINSALEVNKRYGLAICIFVPPSAFSTLAPMIAADDQLQVATVTPSAFIGTE